MNGLLHVSSSPHARSKVTTDKIMFAVLLALPRQLRGSLEFRPSGTASDCDFDGSLSPDGISV